MAKKWPGIKRRLEQIVPSSRTLLLSRVVADGILCYSKELKACIGVQFIPGAVTEQQLNDIAQSLILSPAEKP